MFINAMRLRRSRQGYYGFLMPLFFQACLRQATGAICAGISIFKYNNFCFHLKSLQDNKIFFYNFIKNSLTIKSHIIIYKKMKVTIVKTYKNIHSHYFEKRLLWLFHISRSGLTSEGD